jgi:hypothetical protein
MAIYGFFRQHCILIVMKEYVGNATAVWRYILSRRDGLLASTMVLREGEETSYLASPSDCVQQARSINRRISEVKHHPLLSAL